MTDYRTETKYKTETRYNTVTRYQDVPKTRKETRYANVWKILTGQVKYQEKE